jgi:hypothetical protein
MATVSTPTIPLNDDDDDVVTAAGAPSSRKHLRLTFGAGPSVSTAAVVASSFTSSSVAATIAMIWQRLPTVILVNIMEWLATSGVALLSTTSKHSHNLVLKILMKQLSVINIKHPLTLDGSAGHYRFLQHIQHIRVLYVIDENGPDNGLVKWLESLTPLINHHAKTLQVLNLNYNGELEHDGAVYDSDNDEQLSPGSLTVLRMMKSLLLACASLERIDMRIEQCEDLLEERLTAMIISHLHHWPHLRHLPCMQVCDWVKMIGKRSCMRIITKNNSSRSTHIHHSNIVYINREG